MFIFTCRAACSNVAVKIFSVLCYLFTFLDVFSYNGIESSYAHEFLYILQIESYHSRKKQHLRAKLLDVSTASDKKGEVTR